MNAPLYYFRKGEFATVYAVHEFRITGYKLVRWVLDPSDGKEYQCEFHDSVIKQYIETGYWHKTDWKGEETLDSYFAALSRGSF